MGLNIIDRNPFKINGLILRPKSNKETKEVSAFNVEEQKAFLDQLAKSNDSYTDVFLVALYTGMRIGEVLALSKKDIDLEHKLINVSRTLTTDENFNVIVGKKTKTYSGKRQVPILDVLIPVFDKFLKK